MIQVPNAADILLNENSYETVIKQSIVNERQISPELMIYLMKHQLLQ